METHVHNKTVFRTFKIAYNRLYTTPFLVPFTPSLKILAHQVIDYHILNLFIFNNFCRHSRYNTVVWYIMRDNCIRSDRNIISYSYFPIY